MSQHGKKYIDALKTVDREDAISVTDAVAKVKGLATAKFDETIELAVRLGVDPRKADQIVRGTLSLPSGIGRTVRVAVVAAGDEATKAREAGADMVGSDDLIAEMSGGMLDFDILIATPDLMGQVGTLGRVLGPRGLMPNPKTGTVTQDVAKAVTEFKAGRIEYRTDKVGNIHVPVGKASFSQADLEVNVRAVLDELNRAKPASAKGRFMLSVTLSSTMGPGVKIDPSSSAPSRLARALEPGLRSLVLQVDLDLPATERRTDAKDIRCSERGSKGKIARLTRCRSQIPQGKLDGPLATWMPAATKPGRTGGGSTRWTTRGPTRSPLSTRYVSASKNQAHR